MVIVKVRKHHNSSGSDHGWYIPVPPNLIQHLSWEDGEELAMEVETIKSTELKTGYRNLVVRNLDNYKHREFHLDPNEKET